MSTTVYVNIDTHWAGIKDMMERGEWAGALKEYVHQRAVLLNANPGFDTLMSLNVIRNAVPFEYQIKAPAPGRQKR